MRRNKLGRALGNVLKTDGLSFNLGANDAVWSLGSDSALRAYRFRNFVEQLPQHLPSIEAEVRVVLSAIAFDVISTKQDLLELVSATRRRQRMPGGVRVTWTSKRGDASRFEARCLSSRTEMALQLVDNDVDWTAALQATVNYLAIHYPSVDALSTTHLLEDILLDASAWHFLHLPSCLYSHIQGALSMPVLADAVLSRLTRERMQSCVVHTPTSADSPLDEINEDAMDKLLEPPTSEIALLPTKTIALLKSICSVSSDSAGIRLSTFLATASARNKLALAVTITGAEGWVSAVLTSWITHLLTYGSLRKEDPAITTISGYVNDLIEDLAAVLVRKNKPPSLMLQEDWVELFETLLSGDGTHFRSAALSSLHLWAVRCFGCDPLPNLIFSREAPSQQVHANLIWPDEQAMALAQVAAVSRDERVVEQCRALITLGCSGLFRIGELPSLRTDDIQETEQGLRIEIDPGRGTHGGKSRAARRVVHLKAVEAVRHVLTLRDRRNMESLYGSDVPVHLFGDPNKQGKLYRFGHCVRLINDVLKTCSGDDSVSFHTLRHTSATDRCFQLLTEPTVPTAIAPLHILLNEMGHASALTLWNSYFHLSEFAIRRAIDDVDEVKQVTSTEASFWLQEAHSTLRQQRFRSSTADNAGFFMQRLDQKAFAPALGEHRPGRPYGLAYRCTQTQTIETPLEYQWVVKALSVVMSGTDSSVAISRLSCTADQLKRVCQAVQRSLHSLRLGRYQRPTSLLLDTAGVDHSLAWAHDHLRALGWSFQISAGSRLPLIANYLNKHVTQRATVDAATAWCAMFDHQALSLADHGASLNFLRLLGEAEFPPQALVARVQESDADATLAERKSTQQTATDLIKHLSLESLGTDIRIEHVRPRRGYPSCYLMLGRFAFSSNGPAPSAGLRMREVHGLFFALRVFHTLMERERR